MNKSELLELIRQVVEEEHDYNKLFAHMLKLTGKSLNDMSDMEKKKFFNAVDKAYDAKNEGRLKGYNEELSDKQKQIDVDKDGEIEGSDLAALRANKEKKKKMRTLLQDYYPFWVVLLLAKLFFTIYMSWLKWE